jgi:mRNA interferase RelE/StbE
MRALFKPSFKKDFQALESETAQRVKVFCLEIIPAAKFQRDLFEYGAKKLVGTKEYYRMRIGDYRVGFKIDGSTVVFMRVLHRKEIYKYFP